MRIDELFDQPLPLSWEVGKNLSRGTSEYTASFQVDDKEFKISFNKGINDFGNIEWTVTFGLAGRKHYWNARDIDSSKDFKHKAVLIFSTVADAIDVFWQKENPPVLYYAASSNRQEKTYDRIMKFINASNPEYYIKRKYDPGGAGNYYEITK